MKNGPAALSYLEARRALVERCRTLAPPALEDAETLWRLAEAAGLDASEEQLKLIQELLDLPGISQIRVEFWQAHEHALAELARADPAVDRRLLQFFPSAEGARRVRADQWLSLLQRLGAVDYLARDPAIERGFAAGWLSKTLADSVRGPGPMIAPDSVFAVLRRLADRLQLEGAPVTIAAAAKPAWPPFIDADLCDLALELGVPVADPPLNSVISLSAWASPFDNESERSRHLVHLASDRRFQPILRRAVQQASSYPPFQQKAVIRKGVRPLWHKWFSDSIQQALIVALPELCLQLNRLVQSSSPLLFSHFPDLRRQLAGLRVSTALARTVRSGLLDEFGSDDLDDTIEALKADAAGDVLVSGPFPFLIVSNRRRAIVLSASRPLFEHQFKLPESAEIVHLRYSTGQLLVVYFSGDETFAYWSGEPDLPFIQDPVHWRDSRPKIRYSAVDLGGLGITEGDLAIKPGDRRIPAGRKLLSDGRSFWQEQCSYSGYDFFRFDPNTGTSAQEPTLPPFLSAFTSSQTKLDLNTCELLPVPAGMKDSPLGARSGIIGWRSRYRLEGGTAYWESESIDGRAFSGQIQGGFAPRALLRFPGGERDRLLVGRPAGTHDEIQLYDPATNQCIASVSTGDRYPVYARGTSYILPPHCWHLLAPRDVPGSLALRELSDTTAEHLLAKAVAALIRGYDCASQVREMIAAVIPEITNARVKNGLVGLVQHGAVLHNRLHHLLERATRPQSATDMAADMLVDTPFEEVASALQIRRSSRLGVALGRQIRDVIAFFEAPETIASEDVALSSIEWEFLVGRIGALAYLAVAAGAPAALRAHLLTLLGYWSETPFARNRDKFRTLVLKRRTDEWPFLPGEHGPYLVFVYNGNRYAAYLRGASDVIAVLEYASSDEFCLLPGVTVLEEQRGNVGFGSSAEIERFVSLARNKGPLGLDKSVLDELSRLTGLPREEAVLLWTASHIVCGNGPWMDRGSAEKAHRHLKELTAGTERLYLRLYSEAMPNSPESIWRPLGGGPGDPASFVARLAKAWNSLVGPLLPSGLDLPERMETELSPPLAATLLLDAVSSPEKIPFLNRDASWRIDPYGRLTHSDSNSALERPRIFNPSHWATVKRVRSERHNAPPVFDDQVLISVFLVVPYLFLELPVGDPLRNHLSRLRNLALQRLANPELLVEVGFTTRRANGRDILAHMGDNVSIRPLSWGDGTTSTVRDSGPIVVYNRDDYFSVACRPSLLSELKGNVLARIAELTRISAELSGTVSNELLATPAFAISPALAAQAVMSDGFEELIQRVHNTPVPRGQWEGDPVSSAKESVTELSSILRLSIPAAALYLQRLALPNVAPANLQRWNRWMSTEFDDAMAEVVARGFGGAGQRSYSWVMPLVPVHKLFREIVDKTRKEAPSEGQQ